MRIAITGHRPNKLGNDYDLVSPLIQSIKNEITNIFIDCEKRGDGDITLITGMALGIDTLFALMAIEVHYPFIAAIPFRGQEKIWPKKSQDRYNTILTKASEIVDVSTKGKEGVSYGIGGYMQLRNQWIVDNSNLLIGVWDGTSGGTNNCVKYAQSVGREIIIINPKEL